MDLDARIAETAALVAPTYAGLDLADAEGLLLDASYEGEAWQLVPLALELTEVDEFVGRDGEKRELGVPELDPVSEARRGCEALNDALLAAEDGWVRVEDYWLALARAMHAHLGLPVLVEGVEMPIAEQLRRQQASTSTVDAFAGLNVILSARIDEHRHAGLFLQGDMSSALHTCPTSTTHG